MDRISELSDELLIKILSYLPTKDAVSTSILSRRWECIWLWLPKLKYDGNWDTSETLPCFVNRKLPLHRAPVLESFHFKVDNCAHIKHEDMRMWVVLALSHHLRKLKITYRPYHFKPNLLPNILPSSLYNCKSLVTLKLSGWICVDVPRNVCLPSLKTLRLDNNRFLVGESLQRLLSVCPLLEDLLVNCYCVYRVRMGLVTVTVPSLQRLSFYIPFGSYDRLDGLVIDTPSLKYLKLQNFDKEGHPCLIKSCMPNLEEAYLDFRCHDVSSLIGGITSVKRLTICLEDVVYGGGFVFNQLEYLKLCVCARTSFNLLVRLLEDSPNVRVLNIVEIDHYDYYTFHREDEPTAAVPVPDGILSYLRYYLRRPEKKDLKVYIYEELLLLEDCNNTLV